MYRGRDEQLRATPSIWGTIYSPLTAERDEGADHYWLTVSNLNIHARLGNCCQMGRRRGSESFPPSKGGSGKQNAKTELWNGTEEMEGPRLVWTGNVCMISWIRMNISLFSGPLVLWINITENRKLVLAENFLSWRVEKGWTNWMMRIPSKMAAITGGSVRGIIRSLSDRYNI